VEDETIGPTPRPRVFKEERKESTKEEGQDTPTEEENQETHAEEENQKTPQKENARNSIR
jgi:hypothetical protein